MNYQNIKIPLIGNKEYTLYNICNRSRPNLYIRNVILLLVILIFVMVLSITVTVYYKI